MNAEIYDEYLVVARAAAAYAHEVLFSQLWGLLPSDDNFVVFFNNCPYDDPTVSRSEHFQALQDVLACHHGLACEAEVSYPIGGPDDGYTAALVFRRTRKPKVSDENIKEVFRGICCASYVDKREMGADSAKDS